MDFCRVEMTWEVKKNSKKGDRVSGPLFHIVFLDQALNT